MDLSSSNKGIPFSRMCMWLMYPLVYCRSTPLPSKFVPAFRCLGKVPCEVAHKMVILQHCLGTQVARKMQPALAGAGSNPLWDCTSVLVKGHEVRACYVKRLPARSAAAVPAEDNVPNFFKEMGISKPTGLHFERSLVAQPPAKDTVELTATIKQHLPDLANGAVADCGHVTYFCAMKTNEALPEMSAAVAEGDSLGRGIHAFQVTAQQLATPTKKTERSLNMSCGVRESVLSLLTLDPMTGTLSCEQPQSLNDEERQLLGCQLVSANGEKVKRHTSLAEAVKASMKCATRLSYKAAPAPTPRPDSYTLGGFPDIVHAVVARDTVW